MLLPQCGLVDCVAQYMHVNCVAAEQDALAFIPMQFKSFEKKILHR
jgi:hypothetical protein